MAQLVIVHRRNPYKIHAEEKHSVLTENKLKINGLLELDFGICESLIHVVNNRTMISLYDQQGKEMYVFDRKGNLMPHSNLQHRKGNIF